MQYRRHELGLTGGVAVQQEQQMQQVQQLEACTLSGWHVRCMLLNGMRFSCFQGAGDIQAAAGILSDRNHCHAMPRGKGLGVK